MALTVADRIKETTTTTGTGDYTLAGAVNGFLAFSSRLAVGDITFYYAVLGTQWEVALGTLTSATTMARTTILANSNGDTSPVNFAAGSKEIAIDCPALLVDRIADFGIAEAAVASAAAVDLGAANSRKVAISGTAAITSFGTRNHREKLLRFTDACTLTFNATSLILPTAANIVTAAGDTALVTSDASGNWRVRHYQRADGSPLKPSPSFRNRIRNGNFAVNQRAVSGTVSLAAGAYGHDGWKAGSGGCTYSFSTAANGDVTVTITAGSLLQIMEGTLYIPEGGSYTLSWTGTVQGRAYQGSNNYNSGPSYAAMPSGGVQASGLTAGTGVTVEFLTGTLGLVQFEPGATATPFERRGDELSRCQRYYETGTGWVYGSAYGAGASLSALVRLTPKRATPNVTQSQLLNQNFTYQGLVAITSQDLLFYGVASAGNNIIYYQFSWTASSEL